MLFQASDDESTIKTTSIGLGETKHDVFIRSYSSHDPYHDGWEMVALDAIELPEGVPIWIRIRVTNGGLQFYISFLNYQGTLHINNLT